MKKIIFTKGTEFEQNLKSLALIDTNNRAGKPVMIDNIDLFEGLANADSDVQEMIANAVQLLDTDISADNIKKDVDIFGVTGSYVKPDDANLIPENIKKDVTIYGVVGTYEGDPVPGGDS